MILIDRLLPKNNILVFKAQLLDPDLNKSPAAAIIVRAAGITQDSLISNALNEAYFIADHRRPAGTFLENPLHPIITHIR